MDSATFQVATPPQVVIINMDPAMFAALSDIRNTLGLLMAETRETNRLLALLTAEQGPVVEAAKAQLAYNQFSADLAQSLGQIAGQEAGALPGPSDTPMDTVAGAEGAAIAATEASTTGVAPASPLDLPDPDTLDWFVGQDGSYYVHEEAGDRRATKREQLAISKQVGSSRGARRR